MKKLLCIILIALLICMMFAGCKSVKHSKENELIIFAASSMTETLTQIAKLYKEIEPDVTLTFCFDSSGTLKTQIEQGAYCNIFISASQKLMNQLDITAGSVDLLENKVVLCVPENNPSNITSFDDMATHLNRGDILMAIGNSDVPVGDYTLSVFDYYGIIEEDIISKGCLSYGTNAKEVTIQISNGVVDCGIVYQTDAYSAGLKIVDIATTQMCGQVIYPAAILESSQNVKQATAFLEFLKTDQASAVFEKVGFTPLS